MAAQVNVVTFFGGSFSLGKVDATIGMTTNFGIVMGISGNLLNVGSGTAQSSKWMYDYQCNIHSGAAIAGYSWPTGVLCKPINRSFGPSGVVANFPKYSSGTTFHNGGNTFNTFARGG
jgi:hypothetical protein